MAVTFGSTTIRTAPGGAARLRRTVLVLAIAIAAVLIAPYAMANDTDSPMSTSAESSELWTVSQGETLWSIASQFTSPGENVRDTVEAIKDLNALESSAVRVGDQLLVPVSD